MNNVSKKGLIQTLRDLRKKGITSTVILLLLVLVGNFVLQAALILVLKTPSPLHTPISNSMVPTLKIGDLLVIQGGLTASDIYAHEGDGDIIIFRDPRDPNGIPIVHRAIDKYEIDGTWYIVTKGDNNAFPDDWYSYFPRGGIYNKAGHPENYLLGKVIITVPYLGYVLRTLDEAKINVGGFIITLRIILIVGLILLFMYLEFSGSTEEKSISEDNDKNRVPLNIKYKSANTILYK